MTAQEWTVDEIARCPVEVAMSHLGRKWTIHIIRDLFNGYHRFSDFLGRNDGLSTKVLSGRLKELESDGLIEKRVVTTTPLLIQYHLSRKGEALNRVIIELSVFSIENYTEEVFARPPSNLEPAIAEARNRFTPATIS